MRTVMSGRLLWVLALLAAGGTLWAHKFHASLTQMEFNQTSGSAELALRLFADDLENSLSKQAGKRITLDKNPEQVEAEALKYLARVFQLKKGDGPALEPRMVGMEFDVHVVWVYLEIPLPQGDDPFSLVNKVFFDQFADQVNTVNLKRGSWKKTLIFKPGDGFKDVVFQ